MNKLKIIIAGLLVVPTLAFSVVPASVANAQTSLKEGIEAAKTDSQTDVDANSAVKNFVNIFLWIVGVLSVVMLIWGGIRYVTSSGDSNKVTAAKNTILYAVVGLVIAILSYALVNFVITQLNS